MNLKNLYSNFEKKGTYQKKKGSSDITIVSESNGKVLYYQ